ncbi:MAG: hypothetical protein U0744_17335 [Gemmataceae bacterium]
MAPVRQGLDRGGPTTPDHVRAEDPIAAARTSFAVDATKAKAIDDNFEIASPPDILVPAVNRR